MIVNQICFVSLDENIASPSALPLFLPEKPLSPLECNFVKQSLSQHKKIMSIMSINFWRNPKNACVYPDITFSTPKPLKINTFTVSSTMSIR